MTLLETTIGYTFSDPLLLERALTHPSLAYETRQAQPDNQRLEYLGDAVLQLVLTDELFHRYPGYAEGQLTKLRSRMVSGEALEQFARDIGLGRELKMGRGEEGSGGRERSSNLADAFEALLGAVYLDSGGLDSARQVVLTCCGKALESVTREVEQINPKGQLQEVLQAITVNGPEYRVTAESGPDHLKEFVVVVEWENRTLGTGTGASKKVAEIEAARNALVRKLWE